MEVPGSLPDRDSRDFLADHLAKQKRSGCNILLTGDVSVTAVARMSRRLMGDPSVERQRVLALSSWNCQDINMLLPVGINASDPTVRIVGCCEARQSMAHSSVVEHSRTVVANEDCLDEFSSAIHAAVEKCYSSEDQCIPGELRLFVATLSFLVDRFNIDLVEEFCRTVSAHVKNKRGIGAYYFPVANDSKSISALSSYHDIHIEMKEQKGRKPKYRWQFLESSHTTDWMVLNPPS